MQISECKILIAGCGSIGKRHAQVLSELGVKDLTVFDPVEKQREELISLVPHAKPVSDYAQALAQKPDGVFILSPTRLHLAMAEQALEAGCHVFLEKPLSDSMAGVDRFCELVANSTRKVMVGFCFRYHDGVLRAKELLEKGDIGRIVSIRAMMGEHFPDIRPDYKSLYYAKQSGAFELIHDLDLAIWLSGQPVEKAFGVYGPFSDIGIEAPDTVELLLKFIGDTVATVHLDFFQTPRRRELELIGTEGTAKLSFGSWDEYTLSVFRRATNQTVCYTAPTQRNDMFRAEDLEFLKAITEDGQISCTVEEAVKSLKVVHDVTGGSL